jgi:hypothetical protein
MNDLTPNAKLNPWAELDARARLIHKTWDYIAIWAAAYDALVAAETNPLNTPVDIERYRARFRQACDQMRQAAAEQSPRNA